MKAVVFDLDGTLLNTLEDIRAALNYARRTYDGEPVSSDDTRRYIGNGLRKALQKSIIEHGPKLESEDEEELMFQILMQYYKNHPCVYAKPYDGVIDLLKELKKSGYKLAILSNKADCIVQKIVSKCFDLNLFDYVQGQLPDIPLKPNPAALESVISRLGVDKKNVFYIGDSEVDYKSATACGVAFAIVNYGFRTEKELSDSGIESISSLPSVLDIENRLNPKLI